MKKLAILALALIFVLSASYAAFAEDGNAKKSQDICPIMKAKVNKKLFVDYDGYRIYLCCNTCVAEFRKNPEKWIDAVKETGVTIDAAPSIPQTVDIMNGKPIDKSVYEDHKGRRIYFSSAESRTEFDKDRDGNLRKLLLTGVTPEHVTKLQETCPVMGGKIVKKYFADYNGMRIYFCCAGCDETFRKEPEKYLKILADRGETPEKLEKKAELKAQETCPVMGGKIDRKYYADYNGMRVYFCCPACIETFGKDPEKYLKILADKGEAPEKIEKKAEAGKSQDICPVLGSKINKNLFADYKGLRIYFCCPGCIKVFEKDPEKYIRILRDKGYAIEKSPNSDDDHDGVMPAGEGGCEDGFCPIPSKKEEKSGKGGCSGC